MTKNLGWVVAVALGTLPGVAQAQSNQIQPAVPATAQAAPPPTESDVVWLRRRVEQLEGQLANGGGACTPDAKSKMKRNKDSGMSSGSMGDDKMGSGAMGAAPMNDPMHKMKSHRQMKMNSDSPKPASSSDTMGDM